MNAPANDPLAPAPLYHDESRAVRFWVRMEDGSFVGATIAAATLQYRFQAGPSAADAVAAYAAHRDLIDAAVKRRIAAGSIEPVMLRDADVATPRP